MHVHRTHHPARFVIIPNSVAQHPELSLTARGLLGLLLSQPDGGTATVRDLTKSAREGKLRVSGAMQELQSTGYVRCTRVQDERGRWSTAVEVSDIPMHGTPEPEAPSLGRSDVQDSGPTPKGEKDRVKIPPAPSLSLIHI